MKRLQTLFIILLIITYLFFFVWLWQGLSPEISVIDFYLNIETIVKSLIILTPILLIVSFILGWNPKEKFLDNLRNRIIPALSNMKSLYIINSILVLLIIFLFFSVKYFRSDKYSTLVDLILKEDYDNSGLELIKYKQNGNYKILIQFNDAAIEESRVPSHHQDEELCGKYIEIFRNINENFTVIEYRFLKHLSLANCYIARNDLKRALNELILCDQFAKILSQERVSYINYKMGVLYMRDDGQLISNDKDRLLKAKEYLSNSSSSSDLRSMGNIYYMLKNYAQAIKLWNEGISDDSLENKKLYNGIALANLEMNQPNKALEMINKALAIHVDTSKEDERKEQIRNLDTKCRILIRLSVFDEAKVIWDIRENLKKQPPSKCGFLSESIIYAGLFQQSKKDDGSFNKLFLNKLIYTLLRGTEGCKNCSFLDKNTEAIESLLNNSEQEFNSCYTGLKYKKELVSQALSNIPYDSINSNLMGKELGFNMTSENE